MVGRIVRIVVSLTLLAGCYESPSAGRPDASVIVEDAGVQPVPAEDAGWDAGEPDAGEPDAGEADAGEPDAGPAVREIVSLAVTPSRLDLTVGFVSGVTAIATWSDGTQSDVTGSVEWSTTPPEVAQVQVLAFAGNLAKVETLSAGQAQITATLGSVVSNPCSVTVTDAPVSSDGGTLPNEFRALWVTRFHYSTAAAVTRIINDAADAGFNTIFFQIRGNGDAYYRSQLAPWAQRLTGTLGQDPGWDPLQTAIDAAHARGIQLHAYWNVFSAWPVPSGCSTNGTCTCQPTQGLSDSCTLPPKSPTGMPNHALYEHPDWMAVTSTGKSVDTEYYWFSPGNPNVRARLIAEAEELLTRYDVDGLHLDRIRYPGSTYSHDAASVAAYNALPSATRPTWEEWERQQVSATVAGIYAALKRTRPNAILSASVWGIYKRLPGCSTSEGYGGYYQDSIAWMKNAQIDALVPMIYWDFNSNGGCTDWGTLVDGFLAGSNGRPIIAGMHALDSSIPQMDHITARVNYGRTVGTAGTSIFASSYLDAKTSGTPTWQSQWPLFRTGVGPYVEDAGTPSITWR